MPDGQQRRLQTDFTMATYDCGELYDLVEAVDPIFEHAETYDFSRDVRKPSDPRCNPNQIAVTLVLRKR